MQLHGLGYVLLPIRAYMPSFINLAYIYQLKVIDILGCQCQCLCRCLILDLAMVLLAKFHKTSFNMSLEISCYMGGRMV